MAYQAKPDAMWPQVVTIFIACLTSIASGTQFAWSSPFFSKIVNDTENYNITKSEASHFATIHPFSTVIFSLIVPLLNDNISRKMGVVVIAIPQICFWLITALTTDVYMLYVARVVSGLGDALHYCSVPTYLGEIASPKVRGTWGNIVFFFVFGQFLVNLVGLNFSVQQTAYFGISLSLIFLSLAYFLPESPYFCIAKNMDVEAKKSLRYLRGKEDIEKEFMQLKCDVERQMSEKGTWKDLFFVESHRKALGIGVFLRSSQQFSGIAAFQCYTVHLFEKFETNISASKSALVMTGLLCMTCVSGHVAEYLGRRKSYIYSMSACALMLMLEFTYFFIKDYIGVDLTSVNLIPLIGMICYIIFNACGVILVPTLMLGELFSNNIKTKGVAVLTVTFGLVIFVVNKTFYALESYFGLCAPFLCFGIVSITTAILSIYIVPETKGKTLEEIQQHMRRTKR